MDLQELISVDAGVDADRKAIHQAEFVGQLTNDDSEFADGTQSMFDLTILEKTEIKRNEIKFSGNLWQIMKNQGLN